MNIVVCIKQTPDTAAKVSVVGGHVTWGDSPMVVNPWDEYSIEEAIRLREKHGGKVTALSVGPENTREALKQALAIGVDEAILISDEALKGSDALATSYILAKAIQKMEDVDVIVFGKQAIDGDTGLAPGMTARRLGWPALTFAAAITELDPVGKTIKLERLLEEGRQVVTSRLPAVISVVKEINEPRYPSFMGIRKAAKAQIPVWSAVEAGVQSDRVGTAGSVISWPEIYSPPPREGSVEILKGTPEEVATQLVDKLMTEKVI